MAYALISQPALGKILIKRRAVLKLPIQKAAAKAKIGKGQLWCIEQGRDVKVSTLNKILSAYGLKLAIVLIKK